MELSAGRSGSVPIEAFLAKYSARKVRPVYPAMVRTKKRQRLRISKSPRPSARSSQSVEVVFATHFAPLKFLAPTSLSSTLPPNTTCKQLSRHCAPTPMSNSRSRITWLRSISRRTIHIFRVLGVGDSPTPISGHQGDWRSFGLGYHRGRRHDRRGR